MPNLVIRFIVTEEEKVGIEREASKLHISVSAFIRLLIRQYSDGITFEKKKVNAPVKSKRELP